MTRYVEKKHGLIIGSGNIFFLVNDGPIRDDYRAIVWTQGYKFDQYNTVNGGIETPIQQILWSRQNEGYGKYRLNSWPKHWLNDNVGEYMKDWDANLRDVERANRTIFFKRRKDALAFVRTLEKFLKITGPKQYGY